jgi:hypothetical protein
MVRFIFLFIAMQKTMFASINQYFIEKLRLFLSPKGGGFDTSEGKQLSYFQKDSLFSKFFGDFITQGVLGLISTMA